MTALDGDIPFLDARRFFSRAEITAAWLRQERTCPLCERKVPRDLVDGDHVMPWSQGGPTTMDNLQALCVACNRKKGNREGSTKVPAPPPVALATQPLRAWQKDALRVVEATTAPVLIEACPGAGKTEFALEAAARMFASGEINRVLVAVPTRRLVSQWVDSAQAGGGKATVPLAPPGWRPIDPIYDKWCGAVFTYHALYAQATMFEALAAEPGYRTLVIFDEIHHVGTDHSWGVGAQQAFLSSAHRLISLSGTPFRTTDPIAFVHTSAGRSMSDYTYGYGAAVSDGVCRPINFAVVGGTATFQTPAGNIETVSFEDDLNDQGESYRLRTALDPGGQHLGTMLDIANEELMALRAAGDADAAGLVVCMDCDHADAVAEMIRRRTGLRPPVACSRVNDPDDPAAGPAIENFIHGTTPWLVAVRMVSEGVDIRRLRTLVYATNVVAELSFRQILGRVVRTDPANKEDYGLVVLPADPRLLTMAERIRDEAPIAVRSPIVITDPRPPSGGIAATSSRTEFLPLDSTGAISYVTDSRGRKAEAELVESAKRYVGETGSPIPPFELALAATTDPLIREQLEGY